MKYNQQTGIDYEDYDGGYPIEHEIGAGCFLWGLLLIAFVILVLTLSAVGLLLFW